MEIAFVGLGQMGKPMAANMLKSGARVVIHATSSRSYADLEGKGAHAARSLADVAHADIVFLSLPHGGAVTQVLLGEGGLATSLRAGAIVVDTSTIDYAATLHISQALQQRGIHFVDAPVSGMEARAVDGSLTVMCGGEAGTVEAIRPYLNCIASNILYMGAVGSGQLAKLVNQLLFDINCAALAEILPMAAALGLDPEKMEKIINSGTGRSYASAFFVPRILDDDFSAGYPMRHAYKDLVSAAELGARRGIPMPVLAAATATYQMALLKGYGDGDKGAMIRVFEDLAGVRFRRAMPDEKLDEKLEVTVDDRAHGKSEGKADAKAHSNPATTTGEDA
jgi:3-hydroxyisobutyrate dehydrogenase-like beta-hydroxyacid dehydrogenase